LTLVVNVGILTMADDAWLTTVTIFV